MLVKKIIWMMSSAMVMTVVMVLAITAWTAQKNNEHAAADSAIMVQGGMQALIDNVETLNYDYSAWTAALDAAMVRDVDWLYENMGSGASGAEIHFLEIFWPTDWSSLTWTVEVNENGTAPLTTPIVPLATAQDIYGRLQEAELGVKDTLNFALLSGGDYYLVSASRLQPWNDTTSVPADQLPVNFMAYKLTEDALATLASTFLIDDLSLITETDVTGRPSIPLLDLNGNVIAEIQWTPPRPGDALVRTAILPISIGLAIFLGLSGTVTLMARRNAVQLVASEKEASTAARTDPLTRLPNRVAFNERLSELRREKSEVAVLFMDLNGFKAINDEYGHEVGDKYLRKIAEIANDLKRQNDMIARLGGDEFNIIFAGGDNEQACREYCRDLMHRLSGSIKIDNLAFQPEIAMGFTIGIGGEVGLSELMRQADFAMYTAKNIKSLDPVKYDITLEQDKLREQEITTALEQALDGNLDEFSIAYQPIVDPRTGKMELAEALVRWNSKTLGAVPPDSFIYIAEQTGLIVEIGRLVIDKVFHDLNDAPNLHVSINLSPVQLRTRSILKDIRGLIAKHRIDPKRVTFELTESMLVENPELTAFVLDSLREQGFGLALDDFGVGFSSIGYLRTFNFDKLKIDKSFVDDIGVANNNENLMKALVYLARSLDMKVVAEGVETEDQSKNLQEGGYDLLQGYLFSRPLPFKKLNQFMAKSRGSQSARTDFDDVG